MKIYLASAIDQAARDDRTQQLRGILAGFQPTAWVFDPAAAFTVSPYAEMDGSIREINAKALQTANVLVAWLPAGVTSIGVPMEIDRFAQMGKPIILLSDAPSWMLKIPGNNFYHIRDLDNWTSWMVEALEWAARATQTSQEAGVFPFVVEDPEARLPSRAHADDAGLDLFVLGDHQVQPGSFVDIPSGVRAQLPEWSWGMITGRSSTLRKRGLMVAQGVIDAGYRGPLFAGVWNLTDETVTVHHGERLAQLIILENGTRTLRPRRVESLGSSDRGDRGFGSSGR